MFMNKKIAALLGLAGLMIFGLSGCNLEENNGTNWLDKIALKRSGIYKDSNYNSYLEMRDNGELDDDGYYIIYENGEAVAAWAEKDQSELEQSGEEQNGGIRVTFAKNNFLDIEFYKLKDENKIPIDDDYCYIAPGSTICAQVKLNGAVNNNMYKFADLLVKSFDNGEPSNVNLSFTHDDKEDNVYKLTIPENYTSTEISIIPIGEYMTRTIRCTAYCINENGDKNRVSYNSGKWFVDDVSYDLNTNDNQTLLEIDPTVEYTVQFDYDEENYYIDESNTIPKPSDNTNSGIVSFETKKPNEDTEDYTLALRKLSSIEFIGDAKNGIKSVTVNGREPTYIDSEKRIIGKLKYNDNVTIEVEDNYTAYGIKLCDSEEPLGNVTRYGMTIDYKDKVVVTIRKDSKTNAVNEFKETPYSHAIVKIYSSNNEELIDGSGVADSDKVKVEITAGRGYVLIGKNVDDDGVYRSEMKFSKYNDGKTIQGILDKQLKKIYAVNLIPSDKYGSFEYELDGNPVSSGMITFYEGQKLKATYKINDTETYKIDKLFGGKSDKVSKELTAEDNGKTIGADFFEIKVTTK